MDSNKGRNAKKAEIMPANIRLKTLEEAFSEAREEAEKHFQSADRCVGCGCKPLARSQELAVDLVEELAARNRKLQKRVSKWKTEAKSFQRLCEEKPAFNPEFSLSREAGKLEEAINRAEAAELNAKEWKEQWERSQAGNQFLQTEKRELLADLADLREKVGSTGEVDEHRTRADGWRAAAAELARERDWLVEMVNTIDTNARSERVDVQRMKRHFEDLEIRCTNNAIDLGVISSRLLQLERKGR